MRRIPAFIILAIVFGLTNQKCTVGCLKCSSLDKCLLCDITQGYQLTDATCKLNTQTNCLVLSQSGNCAQCSPNFFLDINNQACVAVGSANVVNNCLSYNSAQSCVCCQTNFYLSGTACMAVNATVPNCNLYSANGVCKDCAPGFLLSNDMTTCVSLPPNNNCLFFTFVGCRQCRDGYFANSNSYFANFASPTYLNNYLTNIVVPSSQWIGLSVCQTVTVNNCEVLKTFQACSRCKQGFYLSNGACFLYPLNPILGCAIYISLSTCLSCQPGLHLSQNTCLANTIIPNCRTYSSSASSTTCTECDTGYFILGNSCSPRLASKNIPNCQVPNPIEDLCKSCALGFELTTDKLACLSAISNCQIYSKSSAQSPALECAVCNNNFYIASSGSTVSCVLGSVPNCAKYQPSQNSCIECINGFFLSNSICVAHVVIPNCVNYDKQKSNSCTSCSSGYYNFVYTTVCVQTTVKSNCAVYNSDGNSCQKCAPNFYLVSGACNSIPSTFTNCNVFSGTLCTLCNSGYMVNSLPISGTCTLPLDYVTAAVNSPCSVMRTFKSTETPVWNPVPGTNQVRLECGTCGNYMYGFNPHNAEAICVNQNQLMLYAGFVPISQCKRYGLNYATSPSVVCMECASGMFLTGYKDLGMKASAYLLATNAKGLQCTSTCNFLDTLSATVIPDDFFGFVNICVAATQTVAFTTVADFGGRGALQFAGNCKRSARFAYRVNDHANAITRMTADGINANAAAAERLMSADYMCLIPATSALPSNVVPVNYLFTDDTDDIVNDQYQYEVVSLTTARSSEPNLGTVGFDFSVGYSNTVDSSSIFPTVFNYKGILERISVSSAQSATACGNSCKNNFSFCDIFHRFTNAGPKKGWAFATPADATASFYTATVHPAGANDYVFVCLRCQFGYQLSYTASSVADNASMPSCTSMQNCASSTTVYGGLTTFLNSVFSCHLCGQTAGANTYPSIWIETDAIDANGASSGTFVGWTVRGSYASATSVQSKQGFKCHAAPSVTFTGAATATIANCAAFGYVTPITTFATDTPTSPVSMTERAVCLACSANTFPTYSRGGSTEMSWTNPNLADANNRLPGWTVTLCTASLNCDTSVTNIFNSCGKCDTSRESALTPVFYAYHDFTLANCFQSITQNCFILAVGSSQTGINTCDTCKAGFVLNDDKVCEQFRVPNQAVANSNFVAGWFVRKLMGTNDSIPPLPSTLATATSLERVKVRIHYLLSFGQLQYGVTVCQSGWLQFPANRWAPRLCVWSSYIYNNTFFPTTTQYINNCLRYNITQFNNRHVCGGCNTGFIPTIDGMSCVSSTPLPNCVFAQTGANTALCYECMDNFLNVNGQCVSTPIADCKSYINTKWSFLTPSIIQCASCLDGMVLASDNLSCNRGQVSNCISYKQGSPTQCIECADLFSLMTLGTNVSYCFPLPSTLDCKKMQSTSVNSGLNYDTVSCSTCNSNRAQVFGLRQWTSLGLVNQPQTICMPLTPIAKCQRYDQESLKITDNTFGCLECSQGFWYSAANSTCLLRSHNPTQCIRFSNTSDECVECAQGSFLSIDKTNCLSFPDGIFMCSQYSSQTVCTQCSSGYFLSSNTCVKSTPISNCEVYSANYTCTACLSGMFLFNSTSCIVAAASNCLTFTSINTCATCRPGMGLQTTNGIISCVSNVLQNCLNATTTAPFTCLVCNPGYFPNTNGVCSSVSKTIFNCLNYDTAFTCTACSQGSILNTARTACNSTFYNNLVDPNCQHSFLLQTPACAQCALGSFFSNGTCVQCTNNTYASGCLSCDPTNVNACLVCRPNFYMNSIGVCISASPSGTSTNSTNATTGSSDIAKSIAASVSLLLLLANQL